MNGKVNRRQFIKLGGATMASFAVLDLGFDTTVTAAQVRESRIKGIKPITTVCPFCASGCGLVVFSETDAEGNFVRVASVQGDPDNPINEGNACAKGSAMFNMREVYDPQTGEQMINPKRILKPMYRAAGSDKWEEKEWDWMYEEIAKRVKETRDAGFTHKEYLADGSEAIVNRNERMAAIGGSCLDNEEAYLQSKLCRALGILYLETQARI